MVVEDGDDEAAFGNHNRSSSFLFDSLYDSSLLAGLSPQQVPVQSDEEESVSQEVRGKIPHLSTQERSRSELLANQQAEKHEAIQWGESSFNLSEWGDSLLVGEHFLDRQTGLRQKEPEASNRQTRQDNADHDLPEEQRSYSQSEPGQIKQQPTATTSTRATTATQNKYKDEAIKNPSHSHQHKSNDDAQNDSEPDRIEGRPSEAGKTEKLSEMKEKEKTLNILQSVNPASKHPNVQNAPESGLYCSPGLQEIFDRWPSMSDPAWHNSTPGPAGDNAHAAAANTADGPEIPQPSIRVGRESAKPVGVVTAEKDSGEPQASECNPENVTERPGSAGDLIPPTQETPPVTPRIKLTTSSVQSPLTAQPRKHSTASVFLPGKPAAQRSLKIPPRHSSDLSGAFADNKQSRSTSDLERNPKTESEQGTNVNPHCNSHLNLKTKPTVHTDQNVSPPQDCASPSFPQLQPPAETESPETYEGFTLQLSQDASLCSSNSGTFSIIDVASDRRLFYTFINEWKTKDRFSLALACEKMEHRQEPEGEIGGKHKRGNWCTCNGISLLLQHHSSQD